MRLRTFTAKTMPEAMARVRDELGADAIILSTGCVAGGISVTAALDQGEAPAPAASVGVARPSPSLVARVTRAH